MRLTLLVTVVLFFPAATVMAQPADVQFRSNTFSTDLSLAESKEPIHSVSLKCRLVDGAAGTLTLGPNVPQFDEFGDEVVGGKTLPLVTLDFTLKLIKNDNDRQLFEIPGPKIVSHFFLVAEKDIAPWGDGRLLVHDKGGKVRYVIDLYMPRAKP